jgi:hypothetical protein
VFEVTKPSQNHQACDFVPFVTISGHKLAGWAEVVKEWPQSGVVSKGTERSGGVVLRIADCGLRIGNTVFNPKSAIRHPQSPCDAPA